MENNINTGNNVEETKQTKQEIKNDNKFYYTVRKMQSDELLEKYVYEKLIKHIKNENDVKILKKIARAEERHYQIWKKFTKVDVEPNKFVVYWYVFLGLLLGYTFVLQVMENHFDSFLEKTTNTYRKEIKKNIKDFDTILKEERQHERLLLSMIDEDRLKYIGSAVLGLNDALVEFTGAIAGWAFAMQSNHLVTLTGLITGVAATLSMASSEYLARKEDGASHPMRAAFFTGIAYMITVLILLAPFMLLPDKSYVLALVIMLVLAIIVIAIFNYYIAVVKGQSFWKKFKEMSFVSLSVALASFLIGLLVKNYLHIEI